MPTRVWTQTRARLQRCQVWALQGFYAFQRGRGADVELLGPATIGAHERAVILAGNSGQRYPGNSKRGLDHLLPPGLGKELHLDSSSRLLSPFLPQTWPEPEVEFVAYCAGAWQEFLRRYAEEQRKHLETVSAAVGPLELALDKCCCEASNRVAAKKRPAFIACLTAFLRWTDVTQAGSCVLGFNLVGELQNSQGFPHSE